VHDWHDWIEHVHHDLLAAPSLLVTECEPDDRLQERLTLERDGIWYAVEWLHWRADRDPLLSSLDILACLPPAISYEEKRSRLAVAREVFLRHVALVKEREQARDKEAEAKVASLSLTPGDSVEHDRFGQGIVQSISGSGAKTEAMIDFGKELGVKRLVLGYAPLKKL
jgi:hypothetical protein